MSLEIVMSLRDEVTTQLKTTALNVDAVIGKGLNHSSKLYSYLKKLKRKAIQKQKDRKELKQRRIINEIENQNQ